MTQQYLVSTERNEKAAARQHSRDTAGSTARSTTIAGQEGIAAVSEFMCTLNKREYSHQHNREHKRKKHSGQGQGCGNTLCKENSRRLHHRDHAQLHSRTGGCTVRSITRRLHSRGSAEATTEERQPPRRGSAVTGR